MMMTCSLFRLRSAVDLLNIFVLALLCVFLSHPEITEAVSPRTHDIEYPSIDRLPLIVKILFLVRILAKRSRPRCASFTGTRPFH